MTGGSNGPEATSSTFAVSDPDACAGLAAADCDGDVPFDPAWAAEFSCPVLMDVVSDVLSPPQPPSVTQAHAASTIPSRCNGDLMKTLPLEGRPRFERLDTVLSSARRA
jgi:hypothetical protein